MDGARFDALSRFVAARPSRRRLLRALAGGLLGAAAADRGDPAAALVCRQGGATCLKDAQCCSGGCDPATLRCACAGGLLLCRDRCIAPCAALDQCHVAGACDPSTGQCTNPAAPDGTACTPGGGAAGTCQGGTCVCTPTTCQAQGATCGSIPDGCGGTLQCGSCAAGQACCGGACKGGGNAPCATDADCCNGACLSGGFVGPAGRCCPVCTGGCRCEGSTEGVLFCTTEGGSNKHCTSSAECPAGETCFAELFCTNVCPALA